MTTDASRARPLSDVFTNIGEQFGPTEWVTMTAEHLKTFGDATYLHGLPGVDWTVSHNNELGDELLDGFLVMSVMMPLHWSIWPFRDPGTWALNYGFDRARFVAPVYVGDRIRMVSRLSDAQERGPGRVLVTMQNRIEIDGREDPALVADWLCMYLDRSAEDDA